MKISDRGLKLIREFEGVRHEAYQDSVGIWTIGVGHTGPDVCKGLLWTDEQIDFALRVDVADAERCVTQHVTLDLSQEQFDALVSFVFNLGCGAFRGSKLLKLLNAGEVDAAGAQFSRWNKAAGMELAGLTRRRIAEKDMFLA